MSGVAEGKKAPPFSLEDAQGKPVSLADFKGRHVVLYFYPKDDTPGCTKEACGFRDFWKDIQKLGAVVVGVSPDKGESHQAFIDKYKLPFPLLCDPEKTLMTAYGAWGEKMMYGEKKIGTIRSTVWIGPDGTVKRHWKKVPDAAEHPAKVLAALQGQS